MTYKDRWEFYRSDEWDRFRKAFMAERMLRDGELICEHCGKVMVRQYDAILHHITPLDDMNVFDANVAFNPDNIMLVCHKSHNEIHERFGYESMTRHIYIVWGSPCAGKREYVEQNAGPKDLIIDIDRLYEAVNLGNRGMVKSNVMQIYRQLVDMVKTRNGRWRTVWVVRTLPLRIDREGLVRDLGGGELIHIDTPKDVCMERAKERGGDWADWVNQYWDRFQL